jgi:hypothetical protein
LEDRVNKSLLIAIAVLIGLSVAVAMTRRSHESETKLEKPTVSAPKIKKEEITKVEITKPGQPQIVLQKQSDKWRVTAPVDGEAAQTSVESVVDKLAELEVIGIAAARKENYKRLEVDAEHAVHVVAKGGEKVLADLHIGAAKSGGTMVRIEGQEPVLTMRGSIRYVFDREVKDFRERDVTNIDNKELASVAVTSQKGTYKFERSDENKPWAQAKGEKPIANFDPEKVTSFLNTAAHLYASDFAEPNESDAATGLAAPQSKVTLTKKDGTTTELSLGKQHSGGQEYYLRSSGKPDVVFRISNFNGERLMPDAKFFEKDPKPAGDPAAANPGMPMAGGGAPGGGLPPEIMKQLQQQMQAKGGHP